MPGRRWWRIQRRILPRRHEGVCWIQCDWLSLSLAHPVVTRLPRAVPGSHDSGTNINKQRRNRMPGSLAGPGRDAINRFYFDNMPAWIALYSAQFVVI